MRPRRAGGHVADARCAGGAWLVPLDGPPLAAAHPRPRAATLLEACTGEPVTTRTTRQAGPATLEVLLATTTGGWWHPTRTSSGSRPQSRSSPAARAGETADHLGVGSSATLARRTYRIVVGQQAAAVVTEWLVPGRLAAAALRSDRSHGRGIAWQATSNPALVDGEEGRPPVGVRVLEGT